MSKVIVITGAGAGLGRTLAKRLAHDGDTVVLLGRTLAKIEEAAAEIGNGAIAVACDVVDPQSVRDAFATVAARHPKIDVLINNAAVYQPFPLAEARDDQIVQSLMTNVAGAIFCAREALKLMEPGGHVINVSSESVAMRFPHLGMYQASKAALEQFSEALYHEVLGEGIRVTTVRAGQMMGEHVSFNFEPEAAMKFHQACAAIGIDLRASAISDFKSVSDVFRAVIDMPADVHMRHVAVHARRPS